MSANYRLLLAAAILGCARLAAPGAAAETGTPRPAGNDADCTVVEETRYREIVVRSWCRMVPETKTVKKVVYSYKEVPFCRPNCPNPLHRCGDAEKCTECECCPRYRRVLVKREVVEKIEGFKCVVEEEKQKVPYTVYRRVSGPAVPGSSDMPPGK